MESIKNPKNQIRIQLEVLLHSRGCFNQSCSVPGCDTFKGVLIHLNNCREGRACQSKHCASSSQIMKHWDSCRNDECILCTPVRELKKPAGGGKYVEKNNDGKSSSISTSDALSQNWNRKPVGVCVSKDKNEVTSSVPSTASSKSNGFYVAGSNVDNLSDEMKLAIRDAVQTSMNSMIPTIENLIQTTIRREISTIMLRQGVVIDSNNNNNNVNNIGPSTMDQPQRNGQRTNIFNSPPPSYPSTSQSSSQQPSYSPASRHSPPGETVVPPKQPDPPFDVPSSYSSSESVVKSKSPRQSGSVATSPMIQPNNLDAGRKFMSLPSPTQQGLTMTPPSQQLMNMTPQQQSLLSPRTPTYTSSTTRSSPLSIPSPRQLPSPAESHSSGMSYPQTPADPSPLNTLNTPLLTPLSGDHDYSTQDHEHFIPLQSSDNYF